MWLPYTAQCVRGEVKGVLIAGLATKLPSGLTLWFLWIPSLTSHPLQLCSAWSKQKRGIWVSPFSGRRWTGKQIKVHSGPILNFPHGLIYCEKETLCKQLQFKEDHTANPTEPIAYDITFWLGQQYYPSKSSIGQKPGGMGFTVMLPV